VAILTGKQDKAVELPELFATAVEIMSDGFVYWIYKNKAAASCP